MKSGAGADGIDRRTRSAPRSASSGRIQHGKKKKKAGCRLPKAVEFLADLSEEEAAAHSPVVLLRRDDGGYVRYWREGGQVRCRDADSAGGESRPGALEALLASGRRNFEELFPKLAAELLGPSPDLDIVETAFRDGLLGSGAAMRRHQRKSKRFATRIGPVKVERTYYLCPDCGGGHFPLDRALGIEGESHAPGAASIIADAVGGGAEGSRTAGGEDLPVDRRHGGSGAQDGGGGRSRQGRVRRCLDPRGEGFRRPFGGEEAPGDRRAGKGPGSETWSGCIDSAAAVGGVSRNSDSAARLEREAARTGLREAEELVVISDGAPWILNVCEELFARQKVT